MVTVGRGHFNVVPRYTCGSPANADEGLALRVAQQEREAFETALKGIYGLEEKAKAELMGLDGIVEHRQEGRRCWLVHDLLTDQQFKRPFPTTLLRVGQRVQNEYGSLDGIIITGGSRYVDVQWEDGKIDRIHTTELRCSELS